MVRDSTFPNAAALRSLYEYKRPDRRSPPEGTLMAKTQRRLKKANHGARPGSARARRAKRKHIKTGR